MHPSEEMERIANLLVGIRGVSRAACSRLDCACYHCRPARPARELAQRSTNVPLRAPLPTWQLDAAHHANLSGNVSKPSHGSPHTIVEGSNVGQPRPAGVGIVPSRPGALDPSSRFPLRTVTHARCVQSERRVSAAWTQNVLGRSTQGRKLPFSRSRSAPLANERVERRLTAILAADVAGYSRLMGANEVGAQ
jgi:hypothetical protein